MFHSSVHWQRKILPMSNASLHYSSQNRTCLTAALHLYRNSLWINLIYTSPRLTLCRQHYRRIAKHKFVSPLSIYVMQRQTVKEVGVGVGGDGGGVFWTLSFMMINDENWAYEFGTKGYCPNPNPNRNPNRNPAVLCFHLCIPDPSMFWGQWGVYMNNALDTISKLILTEQQQSNTVPTTSTISIAGW